jgi:hypothetical protein
MTFFYDWPPLLFRVKSRCELLIAAGNLDDALRLAEELRPGDDTQPLAARFIGATLCGKISTWRGDTATAIGHFELAAWCYDQYDWFDPGVRERIDTWLAEAYISVGRLEDAHGIAARLREIGTRLNRPALLGDAARIGAPGRRGGRRPRPRDGLGPGRRRGPRALAAAR